MARSAAAGPGVATLLLGAFVLGHVILRDARTPLVTWALRGGLALVVLAAPLGLRYGAGWWVAGWVGWYVVALLLTGAVVGLRWPGWAPLVALAALFGGWAHGLVALVVLVTPVAATTVARLARVSGRPRPSPAQSRR